MTSASPHSSLESRSATAWLAFLALALLVHFVLLAVPWEALLPARAAPERVDVTRISPGEIEAIREKWRQKQLILDSDAPASKEAPEDARYSSDRNRSTEKEQRAARSDALPRAGREPAPRAKQGARPKELSRLGVPFDFREAPTADESRSGNGEARASTPEVSETILDDLPVGGENLLNTTQARHFSFFRRIKEAIVPLWKSRIVSGEAGVQRLPRGDHLTVVEVCLDRGGDLVDLKLARAHSMESLNRAALYPWEKIGRFPNPPSELLDEVGQVRFQFAFTIRVSNEGNFFRIVPPKPAGQ